MRILFFLVSILITSYCLAQKDTSVILVAVQRIEKALVEKDSATLQALLHKDLVFGHSSGWVQTKDEVFRDMRTGFLVYRKFENLGTSIEMKKKKAYVKEWINVQGNRNGTEFILKLFILQLWVQTKKGWQLMMRQSARQQ
jgi:hypothetical protein